MNYIVLDLTEAATKDDVQDIIVKNIEVPEYYGRNLDALHDVLTSLKEDAIIDVYGEGANEDIAKYIERLKLMIADAVAETRDYENGRVLFVDLMEDDGSDEEIDEEADK